MVTIDNLHQILMALVDAGVSRARFGDVEIEFTPREEPEVVRMTPPPTVERIDVRQPEVKRAGYAALFGENLPKFSAE